MAKNTQWPKNPQRLTPYPNFRFKVRFAGQTNAIAGISKVSPLQRTTAVVQHREGGDPSTIHKAPGQTSYSSIVLERGVSYDVTFEQWANRVFDYKNSQSTTGENTSLLDYRQDLIIELYNEAGQKVMAYNVYKAWVSDYAAMSDLDANGEATVVIQTMTVEHEGWERDDSLNEAKEPSFLEPPNPVMLPASSGGAAGGSGAGSG